MARLSDVADATWPEELREMAAAQVKAYGVVLHSTRQAAHAPRVALGAAAMSRELARSRLVPARLVALVNLRVAAIVGCPL